MTLFKLSRGVGLSVAMSLIPFAVKADVRDIRCFELSGLTHMGAVQVIEGVFISEGFSEDRRVWVGTDCIHDKQLVMEYRPPYSENSFGILGFVFAVGDAVQNSRGLEGLRDEINEIEPDRSRVEDGDGLLCLCKAEDNLS